MAYAQGSIVLVSNPFGKGRRPVMITSNSERPFQGKQYTIAIVTTTERDEAVRLESDDLTEGALNVSLSFVNPWSLYEFEHSEIDKRVAQASEDVVQAVADGITQYVESEQ